MNNDSKFNDMNKLVETTNQMKTTRFWGVWLIALLVAAGFVLPHFITLVKWVSAS